MRNILLNLFLYFCLTIPAFCQESATNLQQNPSNLKWSQINTPHFRLIFPNELGNTAQKTANTLETVYQPVGNTLKAYPKKISVILQNQTTVSNGFVTLLPRRTEFFITPPQDYTLLGTNNWLNILAVHEFRHVVQNQKALTGWTKAFQRIFGNNGQSLISFLAVPNWFWEGDAVGTETVLTPSGRGRIPTFDMAYRANLLSKEPYSYAKAACGSFKDFVPNHYVNGYLLTTYTKTRFGADAWEKILQGTYQFPFYPFSFSNNIKKQTGLTTEKLYGETISYFKNTWQKEIDQIEETAVNPLKTSENKYFTNYQYPQILPDGRILALKSGLSDIQQFVILDKEQNEEKLFDLGILNDAGMLSAAGTKIVWAENTFDPRWAQRDYSVIRLYDINTGIKRNITSKTRLASPALSPDGSKIAAVETSTGNRYSLVVLECSSGKELYRFSNPDNAFFLHPRWYNNEAFVAITLKNNAKAIADFNMEKGEEKELYHVENENIAHPVRLGEYLFFNSGISGIDNIFAVDLKTGERKVVTNRKFGAFNPAPSADAGMIYFNDFSAKGHRIVSMPFDWSKALKFDSAFYRPTRYFGKMLLQEAGENLLKTTPDSSFSIKKYRKSHIFNFYSWGIVTNSTGDNLNVGVSSQDLLSTTTLSAGYGYNSNEQRGQFYTNFSYQGWYPILDFSYTNTARSTEIYIDRDRNGPLDSLRKDSWNQQQLNFGLRLPLILTHSKYLESLTASVNTSLVTVYGYDLPVRYITESFNGTFGSMIYNLGYARQLKRAARDIAPKWAQSLSIYFRNTPFGGNISASLFAIQGNLYFPGFARHHSLRFRGSYQHQSQGNYRFGSPVTFPRGYGYTSFEDLSVGSIEYRMPLFDPDWELGRLLFLKRLKVNLFTDFAQGQSTIADGRTGTRNYQSFGFDLTSQFHFMRLSQQLEIGVRGIYKASEQQFIFQPLVIDIGF